MINEELWASYERFKASAARFCELIRHHGEFGREAFLSRVRFELTELYRGALALPLPDPETETMVERDFSYWEGSDTHAIAEKLGPADHCWEVFDPQAEDKPVRGSLADHLTDIYADLMKGFVLAQRGASDSEIVWEWRFLFDTHWGFHAVSALRCLHWRLSESGQDS